MSTAVHAEETERSLHSWWRLDVRLFMWLVSLACFAILAKELSVHWPEIRPDLLELVPWIVVLVVVNLLPLRGWERADLVPDWPIQLAAALVLEPVETGLIAFLCAFDRREFKRGINVSKALFNRSQVALMYYLASLEVHILDKSPATSRFVFLSALIALGTSLAINYLLAGTAISLERGYSLRKVVSNLTLGSWPDFALALVSGCVLGAMVAVAYDRLQPVVLFAFLVPTLLGRQTLKRSQMLINTRQAYRSSEEALRQISRQIHDERSDERKLIAADLHDEVLQPLFKVTLMSHVLKADLSQGRLLEIEEDLPQLITAAELASNTLRELIGNLRRSSLGLGGLPQALLRLVRTLSAGTDIAIHPSVEPIDVEAPHEIALYQIAKEALANSLNHSKASNVWIELSNEDRVVRLTIKDDGRGFAESAVQDGHYGLLIMKERATAVGGHIFVDSVRGRGVCVTTLLPRTQDRT
jgi:signal transduction histidine kinase